MKSRNPIKFCTMLAMAGIMIFSFQVNAAEVERADIVSVSLPVVEESGKGLFDFILDPQGLLYETGAARYGGKTVEADATLYFVNGEGEYGFSRNSDRVHVENRGETPVRMTVTAKIENLGSIEMAETDDFSDRRDCCMYLAIVDNQGNEVPVSKDGEVSVTAKLETEGAEYSFGLTGACNADAGWTDISVCPVVTVTWKAESLLSTEEMTEQELLPETESETETEGESETVSETESGPETESEEETESIKGTEAGTETDAEPVTGDENTETESESRDETDEEGETATETITTTETESGTKTGGEAETEKETEGVPQSGTAEETEAEPVTGGQA